MNIEDVVRIKNDPSEGEHQIKHIHPLIFSKFRYGLMWIAIIGSGFVFGLILKWFQNIYYSIIYLQSTHMDATHFMIILQDNSQTVCKKETKIIDGQSHDSFLFRYLRYIQINDHFQVLQFDLKKYTNRQLLSHEGLIEEIMLKENQQIYGKCVIEIPELQLTSFLFEVLTAPFQLLLYLSVVILFGEYLIDFAVAIIVGSIVATFAQYYFLKRSLRELQQLAYSQQKVCVRRNNNETVDNVELTPGDLLVIQSNSIVPCDCILIRGEVMVNEASLTGESIPLPKIPLLEDDSKFDFKNINTLYEGTQVVKSTQDCLAIVGRTGYTTLKGRYFRNILFPKKYLNPFYKHSLKFSVGICILMHMVYFSALYNYLRLNYTNEVIFIRYLFVATWIFPPQIPIAIQIKGAIALVRLRGQQIIGRNIDKIQIAGKTNVICFDKTGTLTNLGMEVKGYWVEENQQNKILKETMWQIMATCHHIMEIDGQLSGDLLDVEMFKFSGWKINFQSQECKFEVNHLDVHLKVVEIFDYDSTIAMMSVIVLDVRSGKYYLYAKGAPEKIQQKSHQQLQYLDKHLNQLTIQGFRVLSLAQREIQYSKSYSREVLEDQLTFVSFLYFENKLKSDTPTIIQELNQASLALKIISGDNILTTIHCAKQCRIMQESNHQVVVLDAQDDHNFKVERIINNQIQQLIFKEAEIASVCSELIREENSYLAITGSFLNLFINSMKYHTEENKLNMLHSSIEIRSNDQLEVANPSNFNTDHLLNKIMFKTKVFARMKPDQKSVIVKNIQDQGNVVAMIGDGANDCSAISQADVGISFCTSDASYTAHFAYQGTSIDCLIVILAIGRQNSVTISLIFQFLVATYCIVNAGREILIYEAQGFGSPQTIYLVFLLQTPILIMAGLGRPILKLANKIPMDNQYSFAVQVAVYYQILIVMLTQLLLAVYIIRNPNHKFYPPLGPIQEYNYNGSLGSALYPVVLIGSTTFIFNMLVTYPFQERIYKNWKIALWCVVHWTYGTILIFSPEAGAWLQMTDLSAEIPNLPWIIFTFVIVSNTLMVLGAAVFDRFLPRTHIIKDGVLMS